MENNAEGRQRARRTPFFLPLLDLDVLSTNVDGVGSLMDGMTIVPSAPSVYPWRLLPHLWELGQSIHLPRSLVISQCSWRSLRLLRCPVGPCSVVGVLVLVVSRRVMDSRVFWVGGWKELRSHSKMPRIGSFQRWSWFEACCNSEKQPGARGDMG